MDYWIFLWDVGYGRSKNTNDYINTLVKYIFSYFSFKSSVWSHFLLKTNLPFMEYKSVVDFYDKTVW